MKKLYNLFSLGIICLSYLLITGCGSIESPNWESETHSAISATIKYGSPAMADYKTIFGQANATDTIALINGESTAIDTKTIVNYFISGSLITVNKQGTSRVPSIGARTGEEPMLNLITDVMLYYGRKSFASAKSSSGTKDDGFKKIRIACHNGGGINAPVTLNDSTLAVGQSAKTIKDFFRFDNHLAVVEFTPQTLKNLIEYSLGGIKYRNGNSTIEAGKGTSDGNFIHWSGLSYTYNRGASSTDNNAFVFNASSGLIENYGSRVKDIYLFNVPEYNLTNDPYDTGLFAALNNPQDSIAIVLNGTVVPAYANTPIYGLIVDFLVSTEKSAATAINVPTGIADAKVLYVDAISRPNEAVDKILSDPNYKLYHRLQGRIRAVE